MPLRVHRVVGVLVLVVVTATGCGSGDAPPPPAITPAVPGPTAPVVPAPSIAVPAPPPAAPTDAPAEIAPPIAPPIRGGDVMWLHERRRGSERGTLLLPLPDRPRPAGPPIAWAQIHHGVMDVRLFGVVSSPYATAEVFGYEGTTCAARVVGARELHTVARPEGDDDPANQREATYLGLELAGCDRGSAGVVGTTVTVLSVRDLAEARGQPAPPELVAVVQAHDDDLGYAQPLAPDEFRVFSLPERDLRIVRGGGTWVLAQGMREIGPDGSNGRVDMVIEAGWRTFFLVSTPSESWFSPLERVAPAIRLSRCVVADASGTPLNVRRLPRSSAEVVATLANDTTLDALVGPSEWARVASTPPGWAHTSGLRCTAMPPDRLL